MTIVAREVRLAARPAGLPERKHFEIAQVPLPEIKDGQVLLKCRWVSVEPMIRIIIDEKPLGGGGIPPLPVGAVIPGPAVAEVVASQHSGFAVGEHVEGRIGWRDYAVSDGAGLRKIEPTDGAAALGVMGLPGFSAYVGLHAAGGVRPGQTVLISGAAGAVGSVAGPLSKACGASVVGIASGHARCEALLRELHYDRAVDRSAPDFEAKLAEATPAGVDLYFDNVGGPLFTQALARMNRRGCLLICGLMSQYNHAAGVPRVDLYDALEKLMGRSLTVRAFSNTDYPELRAPFESEMRSLLRQEKLPTPVHTLEGIENVPIAFQRLFTDAIIGKSVVRLV